MIFNFFIGLIKIVVDFVRGIPVIRDILNFNINNHVRLPSTTRSIAIAILGIWLGMRGFIAIRSVLKRFA